MSLDNIRIVLVEPLYGGNVGAVCRAMANMGVGDIALVSPRGLDIGEARMMACHADDILEARSEFGTLAEAVADCCAVLGATARMGLYRQQARTPREWAAWALGMAQNNKVAVVFGREDNGLTNEELALCTQIIRIPTDEGRASLNLAQAVMICCYELFLCDGSYQPHLEKSPYAASELRERMFDMWKETLFAIGFMKEDKADHMMYGLRRIFSRGALTVDDAHILMGVARQAMWSAGRAKRRLSLYG